MPQKLDELTALYTSLQKQQSEMVSKFAAQELEIITLKARVKLLEDREGGGIAQSGDDAPIKGRSLDEGEEAAENGGVQVVLTTADVATASVSILAGSGVVPTASPTIPTVALIFTTATDSIPYTRRKEKEKMVESDTPKKKKKLQEQIDVQVVRELEEEMARDAQRRNEQIARDVEIARIHAEGRIELISDMFKYQDNYAKVLKYSTHQRKPLIRKQQREFYTSVLRNQTGWKAKHFKGMTLKEIKEKFDPVWKQIQDFIPIGSKEESERFKRKGLRLEQESVKKLKTLEEVKATEKVPEEKKVHTEGQRSYWKIIGLGGSSASYQFIVDMLKHLDREDLNQLWTLVKETLNIRPASSDKEMEIWVELKRLYEPDVEDQLWTHTQNMMHSPVEWKLYDTCGVHHVTSKDKEIFMLVEKDYPLRKGLAIVMISYKLQVENYSQMANDLILKIYKIANCILTASDEFPLLEQLPTANKGKFPLLIQSDATAEDLCAAAEVKELLSVKDTFIPFKDVENISKTSTLPSDSTPRVTSLVADEGSMQQKLDELTALYTSLQKQQSEMVSKFAAQELEIITLKPRVKLLEDREGGGIAQSRDDASIKGRSLDEGEEAAENGGVQVVLTTADVATASVSILAGSGVVPTESPTIPTIALIFTTATDSIPYTKRKEKEKMVESDTPKKKKKLQEQIDVQVARELEEEMARDAQRRNEQIARDVEIARIHAEEELQIMINGLDRNNETIAKYLQEYHQFATELPIGRRIELISDLFKYQDNYAKVLKYLTHQRKPLTRKQQREFYTLVLRNQTGWKAKHFKGMTLEEIKEKFDPVWKQIQDFIPIGSKEESERFKRKGLRLEQESVKKLKTSEEVKATEKVLEEKVKEMMQLVLLKNSASYQFIVDMLKHLDREDLNQLWKLVKETLNIRPASSDKEMEIWVELKRLYEPDVEDQLWTHTQNMMHAPVEWKLFDMCRVHYVTSKDKEIFMLVEKDYPLRKGLAIVMINHNH
nr:hypothetical protein [Tanacetum cinerariifolium]